VGGKNRRTNKGARWQLTQELLESTQFYASKPWWGLRAKEKLLADLFCSGKNGKDGAVAELKAAFEKQLAETESQIAARSSEAANPDKVDQFIVKMAEPRPFIVMERSYRHLLTLRYQVGRPPRSIR
jgi:hypothetical protein